MVPLVQLPLVLVHLEVEHSSRVTMFVASENRRKMKVEFVGKNH